MTRGRPKDSESKGKNGNGGQLAFEADLFLAADKLRKNLEPSDYKHVVLGLIFLRHISHSFEAKRDALLAEDAGAAEDPDEYLADNVFWVPKEARWTHLQVSAKQPTIGKLIDDEMLAIEAANPSLKGVLSKDYNRPALDKIMLGELIDLISGIAFRGKDGEARDVLGRVYEYFLGGFAGSEGKRGGEFYTPRSVVRVLVEMLEPFPDKKRGIEGHVYDPCCGSGGMFVQAERFLEAHGGRTGELAIYGQESNYTTWRLCKMNLAVRGIDSDVCWNNEGSFHRDDALAQSASARTAMGEPALRVIAQELVASLKGSVTVDWMHRDAARARMRVLMKRILRKYGYPPDLQDAAVQTVLQQAEALSSEWARAA